MIGLRKFGLVSADARGVGTGGGRYFMIRYHENMQIGYIRYSLTFM